MFRGECQKLAGRINSRDHGITSTFTATQPIDNLGTNDGCGVAFRLLRRTNPTSALREPPLMSSWKQSCITHLRTGGLVEQQTLAFISSIQVRSAA